MRKGARLPLVRVSYYPFKQLLLLTYRQHLPFTRITV